MPFVRRQRKYYKYIYQDWTQPVLTANGTLGGNSFACSVSSAASGKPAYYALDGKTSTEWRGTTATDTFTFYNPKPLKVTKLSLVQFTGSTYKYWTTSGDVYGSNDNNDWTLLTSYTNDVKDFVIDLSSNEKAFKYYKIQSKTSTYRCSISELTITAQEKYTVEVPSSSITDFGSYKYFKNIVTTKYWKEITTGSRELEYACYKGAGDFYWYYAKPPIGSDMTVYLNDPDNFHIGLEATNSSELKAGAYKYSSLTEDSARNAYYSGTIPRYPEGDLYIDTTVTEIVEGTPEDYTYTTEEIVPVEVTANDDYDFTEFVPSTQFDFYEDNNSLYNITKRHRTYYKYGTEPNATVVGSPTIVDGVVSGFTTANYLLTTKNFTSASNTWEAVAKITTGSNVNTLQFVFGNGGISWRMSICVTGGHFAANLSSNNSSWNISSKSGTYTVLANTNYWVKLKFTGTQYVLEYSVDGDVWNEDLVIDNATPIYNSDLPLSVGANKHRDGVNYPFLGSIDLNQSYIKINGKDWWHGTKAYEINLDGGDVYEDWTQPVLTANTTKVKGGSIVVTCSSEYSAAWLGYKSMDGTDTTSWATAQRVYSGWLKVVFPYKLKISNLNIKSRSANTFEVYDAENGNLITSGGAESKNTPIDYPVNDVLTDTLYFKINGEETVGLQEVKITAQELVKVGGSVEDANYYVNRLKYYSLRTKEN